MSVEPQTQTAVVGSSPAIQGTGEEGHSLLSPWIPLHRFGGYFTCLDCGRDILRDPDQEWVLRECDPGRERCENCHVHPAAILLEGHGFCVSCLEEA